MRQLAAYALEATHSEQPGSFDPKIVQAAVDDWLISKGKLSADGLKIDLPGGDVATIEKTVGKSYDATLAELVLTQPQGDGWFRTTIAIASSPSSTAVSISLSAASSTLAPFMLDVRCPRLVHDLLRLPAIWRLGATTLKEKPEMFSGPDGAEALIAQIWRADRSIPILVLSDYRGDLVHPKIAESLATDLAGLARVARLSEDAAWALTEKKGKSWSCYQGAIRIYWPRISEKSSPFNHPLWTLQRLLGSAADAATACDRIRSQLRRRILSQSAFAVAEPVLVAKTRRDIRTLALSMLSGKADEGENYKALAERQAVDLERLTKELEARETEIAGLKEQVSNLQLALQWKESSPDAIQPVEETPPTSVEDAVLTASDQFKETLVFGVDVNEGIRSVDADAGPPDKILSYLRALSELTEERRRGRLGKTAIRWLQDHGVNASVESETKSNSKTERAKRSWEDGTGQKRYFEAHLKPNEATAPSKCVRIYFEYDEPRRKTIIGWVGRHPK